MLAPLLALYVRVGQQLIFALIGTMLAYYAGGCAWQPDGFPVAVNMDGSLSHTQRAMVVEAAERWNAAVGFEALRPNGDNGRFIQRGRIHVTDRDPDGTGEARLGKFGCRIKLGEDTAQTDTVVHELGHCLGLGHDRGDRMSIMSVNGLGTGGQLIRQRHVDAVRALGELDNERFEGAERSGLAR